MIGVDEARLLGAFGRRLLTWDATVPVRIVTTSTALGVYTAPPMGVLSFIAVPYGGSEAVDRTVTLASFIAAMDMAAADGGAVPWSVLVESMPGAERAVAVLPPHEGWQVPMHAIAGDLMREVASVGQEFSTRAVGLPQHQQQVIADEIWDRPTWAGLPVRVLHAAYRLGMLSNDRAKVAAATCGSWRRFATPRGQVFYRAPGAGAQFDLRVVR